MMNSEVWKHVLLANGFNYLLSTFTCFKKCIKFFGSSFHIAGEQRQ